MEDGRSVQGGVNPSSTNVFRCFEQTLRPTGSPKYSQALMVDVTSRILFPSMFLVFNLIYWPFYLYY